MYILEPTICHPTGYAFNLYIEHISSKVKSYKNKLDVIEEFNKETNFLLEKHEFYKAYTDKLKDKIRLYKEMVHESGRRLSEEAEIKKRLAKNKDK